MANKLWNDLVWLHGEHLEGWDDVILDYEYPHISSVEPSWRQLKTSGSKRLIPLVGVSSEAIKIMHRQSISPFFCSIRILINMVARATHDLPL